MGTKLRAVADGETGPRRFDTILQAVESGSLLDQMIVTRRRIAKTLDDEDTAPRDLAALSKRFTDLSKEIEALERQKEQEGEKHGADTSDGAWDKTAI